MRGTPPEEPQPRMVISSLAAHDGARDFGEQAEEIVGGRVFEVLRADALQRRERGGGVRDKGRFVALAAMRHRREIRCVGLDQQPVERHVFQNRAQFVRFLERRDAGHGDVEAKLQRGIGQALGAGEAMDQAGEGPLRHFFA